MSPFTRFGATIACALSTLIPAAAMAERAAIPAAMPAPADPLAWRQAGTLPALVAALDDWLDANTDLPRRADAPAIRMVSAAQAAGVQAAHSAQSHGVTRGLYDPATGTIYLIRPWDPRNPYDASTLLHELVHHRQAASGHWYCPGAQELPAYRTQDAWLGGMGLKADVNWIAVVLEAGCTRTDFHPD